MERKEIFFSEDEFEPELSFQEKIESKMAQNKKSRLDVIMKAREKHRRFEEEEKKRIAEAKRELERKEREEEEEKIEYQELCRVLTENGEKCGRIDRAIFTNPSPSGKPIRCGNWCRIHYLSNPPQTIQIGGDKYSKEIMWSEPTVIEQFKLTPFILGGEEDKTGELIWDPKTRLYISTTKEGVKLSARDVAKMPYWFEGRLYMPNDYTWPGGNHFVRFPDIKNGVWGKESDSNWTLASRHYHPYSMNNYAHIVPI